MATPAELTGVILEKRCICESLDPQIQQIILRLKNKAYLRMYITQMLYYFITLTEVHLLPLSSLNNHSHEVIESDTAPHSLQTKPAAFFTSLGENSMLMFVLGSVL